MTVPAFTFVTHHYILNGPPVLRRNLFSSYFCDAVCQRSCIWHEVRWVSRPACFSSGKFRVRCRASDSYLKLTLCKTAGISDLKDWGRRTKTLSSGSHVLTAAPGPPFSVLRQRRRPLHRPCRQHHRHCCHPLSRWAEACHSMCEYQVSV